MSSHHMQILENGTLYIDETETTDAGLYLCRASNGIGSDLSKIVRLSVHVPARFRTKFKSETFRKDSHAKLTCEAVGERPMSIKWLRDKQQIAADSILR